MLSFLPSFMGKDTDTKVLNQVYRDPSIIHFQNNVNIYIILACVHTQVAGLTTTGGGPTGCPKVLTLWSRATVSGSRLAFAFRTWS